MICYLGNTVCYAIPVDMHAAIALFPVLSWTGIRDTFGVALNPSMRYPFQAERPPPNTSKQHLSAPIGSYRHLQKVKLQYLSARFPIPAIFYFTIIQMHFGFVYLISFPVPHSRNFAAYEISRLKKTTLMDLSRSTQES